MLLYAQDKEDSLIDDKDNILASKKIHYYGVCYQKGESCEIVGFYDANCAGDTINIGKLFYVFRGYFGALVQF